MICELAVSRRPRIHPGQQALAVGSKAPARLRRRGALGAIDTVIQAPGRAPSAVFLPRPEGEADDMFFLLEQLVGQDLRVIGSEVAELGDKQGGVERRGFLLRQGIRLVVLTPRIALRIELEQVV